MPTSKTQSLKETYFSILKSLQLSKTPEWDIMKDVKYYGKVDYHNFTNNDFLESMAEVIFSSSLDWETRVEPKWPTIKKAFSNFNINKVAGYTEEDKKRIKETPGTIAHVPKIKGIIENAKRMREIIREYGSFANYVCVHPFDLKEDLLAKFDYLGREGDEKVVLDFMKEMGFPVIKDDKHIRRVLYRLGLTNSENVGQDEILAVGKKFADAVGEKMPVIDVVLWSFGDRVCKDGNKRECKKCRVSRCDFHL